MTSVDWNEINPLVIEQWRANDGAVGGPFKGLDILLAHHVGARTGTVRIAPLVYQRGG